MFRWLWPGCEDWIGYLSEGKDELRGKDTKRWKFNSPQKRGQTFTLDISKHKGKGKGKARLIKRVLFLQGLSHRWDCPSEYKMIIVGRHRKTRVDREFDGKAGNPWKGERYKGICEEFELSFVNLIMVSIIEPTENSRATCWATNDIRVIEVRLPWLPKWHWLLPLREKEIK